MKPVSEAVSEGLGVAGSEWWSIIGGPIGAGVGEAVNALLAETSVVRHGQECAGVLYWSPVKWLGHRGVWEVELKFHLVRGAGDGMIGEYEIPGHAAGDVFSKIEHAAAEAEEDGSSAEMVDMLGQGPQWIFGTVHTHPGGSGEISPQDLMAESHFNVWRQMSNPWAVAAGVSQEVTGLGVPSSFVAVLAPDDPGRCVGVVRYDRRGPMTEWTL